MERIFDCGLRIGRLHTLCNISDTYFRKLFIAAYGVPPKKYVSEKRLAQAAIILMSMRWRLWALKTPYISARPSKTDTATSHPPRRVSKI